MTKPKPRGFAHIDQQASAWLVRLSEGKHSRAEQAAFEAWLAEDERHAEAYDAVSCTWEDVGELTHWRARVDAGPSQSWRRRVAGAMRPQALIGMAAAAAAVVLALLFAPQIIQQPDARFGTAVAELRVVRLSDGSSVTLGARSSIDVNFSERERRVTLRSGEAFFEVAHDESRPFFVDAGGPVIRVVGTKFNVHRSAQQVSVAVLEGIVRVAQSSGEAPAAMRTLEAGERVDLERRQNILAPERIVVAQVQPAHVAAWRAGRLSYDDAPLSVLVSDVNRYYAPGVRLASRDLGDLRVTAAFSVDEIPEFLDALSTVLPVSVTRDGGAAFEIRQAQP